MDPSDFIARESRHLAQNYKPLPVVLARGEGVWVWDVSGKRYLDFLGAYSAASFGHLHPRIVGALTDQLSRLDVTSRAFYSDSLGAFAERLCAVSGMDALLPMNTGAEAVETAIKAARRWGSDVKGIPEGQVRIIVAENNFHGRTTTIVGFSSEPSYRRGFGPFDGGFDSIPFGDADALRAAIGPATAAFLVEPIQGEGGIILPPPGWFKEVQAICREQNVLLILDEIQTGMGRTGRNFAFEHEIDPPDALLLGKALGGGIYPVSAFLARRDVMDAFTPGSHGSTFGGNPVACAIGLAALDLLEEEGLAARAAELGDYLQAGLRAIGSPLVREVRGKGLLIGMEIVPQIPARKVCEALMARGLLCKETHETVVRFAPPLVITRDQIDGALADIRAALGGLSG